MINVPPLPSPVIPKWLWFCVVWHGSAWYRASYWMCMRVYYRLHYNIFTHSTLSLKISSMTHTHVAFNLDDCFWCIVSHVHYNDPNFYGLHSIFCLLFFWHYHSYNSFALLYSALCFRSVCYLLLIKTSSRCVCKDEQIVTGNDDDDDIHTVSEGEEVNATTKYHILYRRNHVIWKSFICHSFHRVPPPPPLPP